MQGGHDGALTTVAGWARLHSKNHQSLARGSAALTARSRLVTETCGVCPSPQTHARARRPCGTHSRSAKLTASATLKPWLKPKWKAEESTRTKVPSLWRAVHTWLGLELELG